MNTLYTAPLQNEIVLWWEQPENSPADAVYTVTLGEKEIYAGDRTHCKAEGLNPGTEYSFRLKMGEETIAETVCATRKENAVHLVTDYGAAGDGKTVNTAALQRALDACGPDEEVVVPAGVYLTGGLRLHSDMRLRLEKGAEIRGTENPEDYLPKLHSRFEGTEMECYQSVLNLGELDSAAGPNCRNVLIYGEGTISGGGQTLAKNIIERERILQADYLQELENGIEAFESRDTVPGRSRGRLINLSNCENVHITGLTLMNGASWNVHMVYSRGIVTDHCEFRSEGVWNGDGWDPDSSEDCTLFASHFHTGDDSVAIKSGKNPEGNRINRPTKHIRVFDCQSDYGLGIAIGSEMSGGVEDVKIWHCDLAHSMYGVQIKATKKRGGYVRDVHVRDCVLSRFLATAVLYNDDGEGSDVPPVFENFSCERVNMTGWSREYWEKEDHPVPAISVAGFDVPGYEARHLCFRDCDLSRDGGIALKYCRDVTMENISAAKEYDRSVSFWHGQT